MNFCEIPGANFSCVMLLVNSFSVNIMKAIMNVIVVKIVALLFVMLNSHNENNGESAFFFLLFFLIS